MPDSAPPTEDCQVVELRQYTLKPGARDALVALFDREFVAPQEAVGMRVIGQFRDLDDADRFVWLRGFADMASRSAGLQAFYGGPAWLAHREEANATMVDSDDVLLLRPAWPGASFTGAARPPAGEAQDALRVIESASRTALAEMRHLLGVLRSDVDGVELAPVPGVAGLPALADRAEQAGVPVELDVRCAERLPDGVALSVYRIVQEALTNVVRHAAPTRCRVSVVAEAGEVRVEVTDDGPGTRTPAPERHAGHGLIGMRERVLMYGGSLHAGPRPEGGFGVSARIPYEP